MKRTIRFVGTFGATVGTVDFCQLVRVVPRMFGAHTELRTPPYVLGPMLLINGTFCLLLVWFGILAWFQPLSAIRRLRSLFIAEILYFLLQVVLSDALVMPRRIAESFGASFGVGGVGMYLQVFSCLPVWGLVLAFLALRNERAAAPQRAMESPRV